MSDEKKEAQGEAGRQEARQGEGRVRAREERGKEGPEIVGGLGPLGARQQRAFPSMTCNLQGSNRGQIALGLQGNAHVCRRHLEWTAAFHAIPLTSERKHSGVQCSGGVQDDRNCFPGMYAEVPHPNVKKLIPDVMV